MNRLVILIALFICSCKAAKPELAALGTDESASRGNSNSFGNGRIVVGADPVGGTSPSYKVKSRVSLVPQGIEGTSPSYKVRGHVDL